ncbi:YgaP family membrane protein [Shouchella patagoniensis]|uniref:YgaP family membrane protein n=1 Tax=Shouchella patagoniensis TaxID=228576 RepID=UPI00099597B3|nr:DUF2892 domain-containing protein [Shouchella patagoniensis]
MEKNLNLNQALCRLAAGLAILTFAGAKRSRQPSIFSFALVCCGALKTAEGILRYCPLISIRRRKLHTHKQPADTINPS